MFHLTTFTFFKEIKIKIILYYIDYRWVTLDNGTISSWWFILANVRCSFCG